MLTESEQRLVALHNLDDLMQNILAGKEMAACMKALRAVRPVMVKMWEAARDERIKRLNGPKGR